MFRNAGSLSPIEESEVKASIDLLSSPLSLTNYYKHWELLLHIEERQEELVGMTDEALNT